MVMFAFALVNPSAWVFIIPAALIFNKSSEAWIWDSLPKEGKKRLRKIWARNAREQEEEAHEASSNTIIQNITIKDSVVMGSVAEVLPVNKSSKIENDAVSTD